MSLLIFCREEGCLGAGQDKRSLRQTHQSAAQSGLAAANSNFLPSVLIYWIGQEGSFGCTRVPSLNILLLLYWMGFLGVLLPGVSLLPLASAAALLRGLCSIIQVSSMLWVVGGTDVCYLLLSFLHFSPLRWRKDGCWNQTSLSWGTTSGFRLNCLANPSKFLQLFLSEPGKDI